jgi:hypothetical protein
LVLPLIGLRRYASVGDADLRKDAQAFPLAAVAAAG